MQVGLVKPSFLDSKTPSIFDPHIPPSSFLRGLIGAVVSAYISENTNWGLKKLGIEDFRTLRTFCQKCKVLEINVTGF